MNNHRDKNIKTEERYENVTDSTKSKPSVKKNLKIFQPKSSHHFGGNRGGKYFSTFFLTFKHFNYLLSFTQVFQISNPQQGGKSSNSTFFRPYVKSSLQNYRIIKTQKIEIWYEQSLFNANFQIFSTSYDPSEISHHFKFLILQKFSFIYIFL